MTQRCAITATLSGLPLAGTAPHVQRWLIAEQRIPFAARALDSPRLDPQVRVALGQLDATIVLARRARAAKSVERFWYADVAERRFVSGRLLDLVDALSSGQTPESAADESAPSPALFVCTNGKRDQCCALEARPIVDRLVGRDDVWECTHLGGHRFAPTALVLPTGYVYGRLDIDTALAALDAAQHGEIVTVAARGRTDLASAHQVADLAARANGQPPETWLIDSHTIASHDTSLIAELAYDNDAHWRVSLTHHADPAVEESCGGRPVAQYSWLTESVRKL